jgi:hypothetical protein
MRNFFIFFVREFVVFFLESVMIQFLIYAFNYRLLIKLFSVFEIQIL